MSAAHGEYRTIGRLATRREAGGFTFLVTAYDFPARVPRHSHDRGSLTLVLAGAFEEHASGLSGLHRAGTLVHKPPCEAHSNRFEGPARTLVVQLPLASAERDSLFGPPLLGETFARRAPTFAALGRRFVRELDEAGPDSELALQCLVYELIGLAAAPRAPVAGAHVARARARLHDDFATPLDLAALASELGVSACHLARSFRRALGCTLGQYQRRLRVAYALACLARGSQSIAAVAQTAGFVDQSHLNRVLRRYTGLTPGEYRRGRSRRTRSA